jgi:hypothetical protein
MTQLILKCAPIGDNLEDYDVLEDGVVVGRIFFLSAVAPRDCLWMWAGGHNGDIERAAHGYEPTREEAMAPVLRRAGGGVSPPGGLRYGGGTDRGGGDCRSAC